MNLVRWSPLGLAPSREFAHGVDRLLDSFLTEGVTASRYLPPVDVHENADEYVLRLDLPGVSSRDVQVKLTGDALSIRGERKFENLEKGQMLRSERFSGSFERTFTLTAPVQGDRVKATFKDGVLEIRIPKAEEAKVREIQIQAE